MFDSCRSNIQNNSLVTGQSVFFPDCSWWVSFCVARVKDLSDFSFFIVIIIYSSNSSCWSHAPWLGVYFSLDHKSSRTSSSYMTDTCCNKILSRPNRIQSSSDCLAPPVDFHHSIPTHAVIKGYHQRGVFTKGLSRWTHCWKKEKSNFTCVSCVHFIRQ